MPDSGPGRRDALRDPQTLIAFLVGLAVLLFFIARAPERPGVASQRLVATPFPTVTPGASPTFGPSPTPAPPTPTATPDLSGQARDEQRRRDLIVIAGLLDAYFAEHGAFPATGPNVQSLCVYRELDAGCALRDYALGGELPANPRGEPYQYLSQDGAAWVAFAMMEFTLPEAQRCAHPAAVSLGDRTRLLCITGSRP